MGYLHLVVSLLLFLPPVYSALTSLTIIDTSTNTAVGSLEAKTYTRSSLPSSLSLRADVSNPSDTSNVKFTNADTGSTIRTESVAPYAIAGDSGGVYKAWDMPIGTTSLKVIQTLKSGGTEQLEVQFTVTEGGGSTSPPDPTPVDNTGIKLWIVDTSSSDDVVEITSGKVFNKADLPAALSIRADIQGSGSVKFFYNGAFIRTENVPPYAIAGDKGSSSINPWTGLQDGQSTLKVEQVAGGTVAASKSVTFTVSTSGSGGGGGPTVTPSPSTPATAGPDPSVKLIFVDVSNGNDFGDIAQGETYNRATLPASLTIRADILDGGSTSYSVKFFLGNSFIRQENVAPYAIAGDSGGTNYNPWTGLSTGQVTLKAEALSGGSVVASTSVTFTIVGGEVTPTQSPTSGPTPTPGSAPAKWETLSTSGTVNVRHEACFVMGDDGKGYLIGGRGTKPTNVFDPKTNSWTSKKAPPLQLHHMQCIAYQNKIWIGGAWTGGFPFEQEVDFVYVYDIATDSWSTRPGLPPGRRRGGGAWVLYQGKMYLAAGNRGGHGGHATTLGELDMFDPAADGGKGAWSSTSYPDAPDPRDHTAGGIVNGKLCIGGGRDGGQANFGAPSAQILPVNCYDFKTNTWERGPNIPQGRAGVAGGTTCDGELMIVGGEGAGQAYKDVSLFDGEKWTIGAPLNQQRHGSGLAVSSDCKCKKIYIASGAGNQGGGPELSSTEVYLFNGQFTPQCNA